MQGEVEDCFDRQVVGAVVIFRSYLAFYHAVYCMLVSHIRSMAVLSPGYAIVPGGISSCIPCWSIPSISSSACWSCLW